MNRRHFFSRLLGAAASVVAGVPVLKAMVPKPEPEPQVFGPVPRTILNSAVTTVTTGNPGDAFTFRVGYGDDWEGAWQEWDGKAWVLVQRVAGMECRTYASTPWIDVYQRHPHPENMEQGTLICDGRLMDERWEAIQRLVTGNRRHGS